MYKRFDNRVRNWRKTITDCTLVSPGLNRNSVAYKLSTTLVLARESLKAVLSEGSNLSKRVV